MAGSKSFKSDRYSGWLCIEVSIRENVSEEKNGFIPLCIPYLTPFFLTCWQDIWLEPNLPRISLFFHWTLPPQHYTSQGTLCYLPWLSQCEKCSCGKWVSRSTRSGGPGMDAVSAVQIYSVPCALLEIKIASCAGWYVSGKALWGGVGGGQRGVWISSPYGCLQSSSRIREWPWPVLYPSATSSVLLLAGFADFCNISWCKVTNPSLVGKYVVDGFYRDTLTYFAPNAPSQSVVSYSSPLFKEKWSGIVCLSKT